MKKLVIKIFIYYLATFGLICIFAAIWLNQKIDKPQVILSEQSGLSLVDNLPLLEVNTTSTSDFRLTIPAIAVDMNIISSQDELYALSQGAWHLPGSGTPDNPDDYKNIVISAHRYLYTSGPNTFFNLDKVVPDDQIVVTWAGKEYKYKIVKIYIVEPTAVSILEDTGHEKLTLFTCHPKFSTKQRLVVEAYPDE